jgi:protein-tyrosine phosphatase
MKYMFKRITLIGLMAATTLAHSAITKLSCVQTGPTQYKLAFSLTDDSHTVQIFASNDPSGTKALQPILKTSSTHVTVSAGKAGERMYFFLKPDHGEQREVSIRRLPLEGTPNFRDLGGYETTDGHFVRWGKIYRSGVLSYLTPADLTYLSQLNMRVVCDFRTQQENADAPEKWIDGANTKRINLPIGADASKKVTAPMEAFMATNPTSAQLRDWMTKTYGSFAFTYAPEYAQLFAQLKEDRVPLLYHCTAGKDRTGVFTALLLLSLGVPEQTVLADYELTDQYLLNGNQHSDANQKMKANMSKMLSKLTPDQKKVLMAANPEYLKNTLRTIGAKYGSFDNYRRQALGVSDSDLVKLRAELLTN